MKDKLKIKDYIVPIILNIIILNLMGVFATANYITDSGITTPSINSPSLNTQESYIIYNDNGIIKGKNGWNGLIELSNIDASTVIRQAINNLTSGTIYIKGDMNITQTINITKKISYYHDGIANITGDFPYLQIGNDTSDVVGQQYILNEVKGNSNKGTAIKVLKDKQNYYKIGYATDLDKTFDYSVVALGISTWTGESNIDIGGSYSNTGISIAENTNHYVEGLIIKAGVLHDNQPINWSGGSNNMFIGSVHGALTYDITDNQSRGNNRFILVYTNKVNQDFAQDDNIIGGYYNELYRELRINWDYPKLILKPNNASLNSRGYLSVQTTTGASGLFIDAEPEDKIGTASIDLFRVTNTTGIKSFKIHNGTLTNSPVLNFTSPQWNLGVIGSLSAGSLNPTTKLDIIANNLLSEDTNSTTNIALFRDSYKTGTNQNNFYIQGIRKQNGTYSAGWNYGGIRLVSMVDGVSGTKSWIDFHRDTSVGSNYISFGQNDFDEWMRMSGGNLLINTQTSTNEKLQINGTSRLNGDVNITNGNLQLGNVIYNDRNITFGKTVQGILIDSGTLDYDLSDATNQSNICSLDWEQRYRYFSKNLSNDLVPRLDLFAKINKTVWKYYGDDSGSVIVDFNQGVIYDAYSIWNTDDNQDFIHNVDTADKGIDFQTRNADGSIGVKFFIQGGNQTYGSSDPGDVISNEDLNLVGNVLKGIQIERTPVFNTNRYGFRIMSIAGTSGGIWNNIAILKHNGGNDRGFSIVGNFQAGQLGSASDVNISGTANYNYFNFDTDFRNAVGNISLGNNVQLFVNPSDNTTAYLQINLTGIASNPVAISDFTLMTVNINVTQINPA